MRYRVAWSASSNISFHGSSDWEDWDDPEATSSEIEEALTESKGGIADGFDLVLDASGFEWWVEVEDGLADEGSE